jgi:hypothetical protein
VVTIELTSISFQYQNSAYNHRESVTENSTGTGNLIPFLFLFTSFIIYESLAFTENVFVEGALEQMNSYSLSEFQSSSGRKILLHEIDHKQKAEFSCSLITCLIRSQYFAFYYSFICSLMQSLNEHNLGTNKCPMF